MISLIAGRQPLVIYVHSSGIAAPEATHKIKNQNATNAHSEDLKGDTSYDQRVACMKEFLAVSFARTGCDATTSRLQ